jgi:hypothetical protein
MKPLKQALTEANRDKLIDDVVLLIDEEVGRKGGLSGMALKAGYKGVKGLKGGRMIHLAVGHLLVDFTDALETVHARYRDDGAKGSFADYLKRHEKDATSALLHITDRKIGTAENPLVKKTYSGLRGHAEDHVKEALPGVGRLVDRYTAA